MLPHTPETMSRRGFLRLGAVAAAGLPLLLEACGGSAAPSSSSVAPNSAPASAAPASSASAPASVSVSASAAGSAASAAAAPASAAGSAAGATKVAGVTLPSYVPFSGPTPDFPGSADGVVLPGYLTYPKTQPKTVPAPFGKGEDINTMMSTTQAVPTPVDQNPAWQQVNKEMGVNFKMTPAQITDYPVKLNAVIAGGQLPDILSISTGTIVPNLPGFLDALCQDLTPYLSGDAIKAYPNLANIPTYAWRNCVFNGKIYCVPDVRTGITGAVMFAKGALTDPAGGINFKDTADFTARMKALTTSQRWGLGVTSGQANGVANAAQWFTMVFGAPNNWSESGGKLTKNWETDQFKAAIDYTSQLWKAGVISPDSPNQTVNQAGGAFYAAKSALWANGFVIGDTVWNRAKEQDPNFNLQAVIPFSPDGGKTKPVQHLGPGFFYLTVLKKASADRVKLALNVLNYLATPFGTAEQLLLSYGAKDVDFKFDAKGNPVQTQQGTHDNIFNTMNNLGAAASVLYDAQDENYAKTMFPAEKTLQEMGIQDPVVGLYSATNSSKGAILNQKMGDGLNSIIFGKDSMSSYDQLVKDWKSGGGDQIRSEYEQALQASK